MTDPRDRELTQEQQEDIQNLLFGSALYREDGTLEIPSAVFIEATERTRKHLNRTVAIN